MPVFTDSLHSKIVNKHTRTKPVIKRICGPVEKLNDSTFAVSFYRMGVNNTKRTADICLMASNDGDITYKSCVQQSVMHIPYPIKDGVTQQIIFDSIDNINQRIKFVDLHATSTSGMSVYFYVREGPAEIINGKLVLTLPGRLLADRVIDSLTDLDSAHC